MTTATVNQGDALARVRNAANLSRPDIAELTQLSLWTLSSFERGVLTPTDAEWALLAKAIGVSVEELQEGT